MQHPMIHTRDSLSLGPWFRLQSTLKTSHLTTSNLLMVQRLYSYLPVDSCIRYLLVNTNLLMITGIDPTSNTQNEAMIWKEELRRPTEKEQARSLFQACKASRQTLIPKLTKANHGNCKHCLRMILYRQLHSRTIVLCEILNPMAIKKDWDIRIRFRIKCAHDVVLTKKDWHLNWNLEERKT